MAKRYNEGKALDAVLRFIEQRDNALRENDGRSPDNPKDPDPDPLRRVDYVCTIGRTLCAFEHTRIEPFSDQIELGVHNEKLFAPIVERFDKRSDWEVWDLIVPFDASVGLTVNDVPQVQDALISWIGANAARVPVSPPQDRRLNSPLGQFIANVPFQFSLHRTSLDGPHSNPLRGRFRRIVFQPPDLESQRALRLKIASESKLPKLAKWKQDSGARTILVLEEDDLWLTNHFLVSDALAQAETSMSNAPDEVFLVTTCSKPSWPVVCLRGPGRVDDEPMPYCEFDPNELTKLTSR